MWDPVQYGRYSDERARPFSELMARVTADRPRFVVDLGCGDGSLTATLRQRWPEATVVGVDSSAEMLAEAAGRATPRLSFRAGRIEDWEPDRPIDVVVSNAALHWVPDHRSHLPHLVEMLAPGGWLAIQMPGNGDAPSHRLLTTLRRSPRWRDRIGPGPERWPDVAEPADYARQMLRLGCRVDAWETTYVHVLPGPDPVLEWTRGTALRPVLAELPAADAAAFEADYGAELRTAYPAEPYGSLLPFRRIFLVAQRG